MKGLIKNTWGSELSIKDSIDLAVSWCIKLREKNVIQKSQIKPYYSYIVKGDVALQNLINISDIFKFSQRDLPYTNVTRNALIRCLAVAIRNHYLLHNDVNVEYEPYFTTIPNLNKIGESVYVLIYKLSSINKTIIVSNQKIDLMFGLDNVDFYNPILLNDDSFKWFSIKDWQKNNNKIIKNEILNNNIKNSKTIQDLEKYVVIVDVPYQIKDIIKVLNVEWHKDLRVWYTYKWNDIETLNKFIDEQMH